jgi:hypothetical protein
MFPDECGRRWNKGHLRFRPPFASCAKERSRFQPGGTVRAKAPNGGFQPSGIAGGRVLAYALTIHLHGPALTAQLLEFFDGVDAQGGIHPVRRVEQRMRVLPEISCEKISRREQNLKAGT